jgi:aspartate aminotransferase-like enzyme
VAVSPRVRAARDGERVNHRSPAFGEALAAVREGLGRLTGAAHTALLVGTGTLANDAVAAQLACHGGSGLILVTGEFGERLVSHARGAGLAFDVLACPWGEALGPGALERALAGEPAWVWAVHHETSTGALLDVADLGRRCRDAGAALALDGVSAVGAVPVDYREVDWVSTVSGKALAAYPGLAMVLARAPFLPPGDRPIAPSLDLSRHGDDQGVPTTVPSELVAALAAALEELLASPPWKRREAQAARLREGLVSLGLQVLRPPGDHAAAVTTVVLPGNIDGAALGRELAASGIHLHYESGYLQSRNWIQLCLMGPLSDADLERTLAALGHACDQRRLAGAG